MEYFEDELDEVIPTLSYYLKEAIGVVFGSVNIDYIIQFSEFSGIALERLVRIINSGDSYLYDDEPIKLASGFNAAHNKINFSLRQSAKSPLHALYKQNEELIENIKTPKYWENLLQIPEQDSELVMCNCCGNYVPISVGIYDFRAVGGYYSVMLQDMNSYNFSMCEKCLKSMFAFFKYAPTINDVSFINGADNV